MLQITCWLLRRRSFGSSRKRAKRTSRRRLISYHAADHILGSFANLITFGKQIEGFKVHLDDLLDIEEALELGINGSCAHSSYINIGQY